MFKQLMQADAIRFCQIDACRLGGVNEVLAVLLLAAKFGVPVCPHAGGVGLCEYVQHLSIFDYIASSASLENRIVEYVDHLHEHFVDPVVIQDGRYMPPGARLQHRDEARVPGRVRVPLRRAWATEERSIMNGRVAAVLGVGPGLGAAVARRSSPAKVSWSR